MKTKKLISVFLALILAFGGLFSLTATAAEVVYEKNCPLIYVPGFMSCEIYKNPGTEQEEVIWPPSSDAILGAVKKSIPALVTVAVTKEWDVLCDTLIPAVNEFFEPAWLNKNGEADNTGVNFTYPSKSAILSSREITFRYDWRLSPIEISAQLNDFIEYVCKTSGYEKVCLQAHSYGGIVTMSYIDRFGRDRLQGVVLDSTALFGETYTGELLTGNIALSVDAIRYFLSYVLDGTEYQSLVSAAGELLSRAGILDFVINFADEMLEGIRGEAIPQVVMPLFCRWPSIWAMCPDEYVDEAYIYSFGKACDCDPAEYAQLIEKLKAYDNTTRANMLPLLTDTEKQCRFGVFSSYGYSSVPITPSWNSNGDGVVDTKYTSFGATVAPVGKTLSEDYISTKDPKYISPDKQVDASTCLFPEKTWFVRYLKHSQDHGNFDELTEAIVYCEEEVTVDTFEKYPRFMKFDNNDKVLSENTKDDNNIFIRFFRAILDFFEVIKKLFSKVF